MAGNRQENCVRQAPSICLRIESGVSGTISRVSSTTRVRSGSSSIFMHTSTPSYRAVLSAKTDGTRTD